MEIIGRQCDNGMVSYFLRADINSGLDTMYENFI